MTPVGSRLIVSRIVAILIVCLAVLAAADHAAQAAITNVAPLNAAQEPMVGDRIFDNEEIWAYVSSPTGGVVCIRPAAAPPGGCQDGGAYSETPVTPFFAGIIPIAAGNLKPGAWVLQGAEPDGESATAVSGEFYVAPCVGCPPGTITKNSAFATQSAALLANVNDVCGKVAAASKLWRTKQLYQQTQAIVAGYSGGLAAGGLISIAVSAGTAAYNYQNGDSLTAKLPGKLSTVADGICKAAERLTKLKESTLGHYVGLWAADPPDPAYYVVTPPKFTDFDSILGLPSYGFDKARGDLDATRAYAEASLHDFERYQGAVLGSEVAFQHAQGRATGEDLQGYANTLRQSARFVSSTAAQIRSEVPEAPERTVTQGDLAVTNAYVDRVRVTGFNASELSQLQGLGLNSDAIARFRVDETLYDPSDAAPGLLDPALDSLATEMRRTADLAEAFSREAAVVAGRSAQPIGADFAHAASGPDLLGVRFDDTSPNPGLDPIKVTWDFGDGTTAAGSTVTHTYAVKGTYVVTQTVTSDYASDTRSRSVVAGRPNVKPVASFSVTSSLPAAEGSTVSFDASQSSDPDGVVSTYVWDFGDGSQSAPLTQPTVDHVFATSSAEGYTVSLTVQDDAGGLSTTTRKVVVVNAPVAPTAPDYQLDARPIGVIDVLARVTDDNGERVGVTATGAPDHGTVSCSAAGACTYAATAGYVGPDSFTYTVRDPGGLEATGTVTVAVTAPPAVSEPLPVDDTVVVRAGTPATVRVLANDAGRPAVAFDNVTQPPQHGSVACDAEGACTYTSAAGFAGSDGFVYRMHDDTLATATAEVHITVVPADSRYSVGVTGGPDPLPSGSTATWGIGVAGSTPELPGMSTQLSGDHARVSGSTRTARGWTATAGGAQAGPSAVLGDSLSIRLVKPAAGVSQGTGGDGHVPIIVGDRIFAFFHHSIPTSVSCIDRRTNRRCPGYPVPLNVGTDDIPGPGVVIGTRIYQHVLAANFYAQTASISLFCWDTATAQPCGFVVVDRIFGVTNPGASTPVLVNGKLYIAATTGKLYCVDPATHATCGALPTGLSGSGSGFDVLTRGSRIFVAQEGGRVACVDVSTGSTCLGWSLPKNPANNSFNLINRHGPDGAVTGVCLAASAATECFADAAPSTSIVLKNWPAIESYYNVTQEAETGTRTLQGSLTGAGAACYDWVTLAPCVGGAYGVTGDPGRLSVNVEGDPLPSAYGVTFDGACVVGLGDPGLVFTLDPKGFAPCTGLTGDRAVDLRDQRCDQTVGGATWDAARLQDVSAGELAAVRMTVRDATTGAILASKNLVNGALDLSGIDAKAHPAITLGVAVTGRLGTQAWADAIPPRVTVQWKVDPRQLCFQTATQAACQVSPISVASTLAAAITTKQITVEPTGCPAPAPPPPPPAPAPTLTPDLPVPRGSTPPSPPGSKVLDAADLVLGCSDRRVVLEDVFVAGGKVQLLGVADRALAGQQVQIVFAVGAKVVATAKVRADGHFAVAAPLPPRTLRSSNRSRYMARIGSERSLNLKLARRMLVTRVASSGGRVTIAGRVTGPLASRPRDRTITVERVVGCKRLEAVETFVPSRSGAFSVTVDAPPGQSAAVYRLSTRVRLSSASGRLVTTFTLPRAVDFR